jgi:hypothetical protein
MIKMAWQLISTIRPKANTMAYSRTFRSNLIRLSCSFKRDGEADWAIIRQVINKSPLQLFGSKKIILRQNVKEIILLEPIPNEELTTNRALAITTRQTGWTIRLEAFRETP